MQNYDKKILYIFKKRHIKIFFDKKGITEILQNRLSIIIILYI